MSLTSDNYDAGLSIPEVYLTCLYFTFTSLSTVGFGNAAPQLHYERVYSICVMVFGGTFLFRVGHVFGSTLLSTLQYSVWLLYFSVL